jgi:prepilin-type N-terminal cleavage/methylation domain-containing protein
MNRLPRAFTIIELLVVIGLIGILAAGVGLALSRGNSGTALQAGQGTLQSLISAARAQAAIRQATADLVIDTDRNSDGFLRTFYIVVGGEAVGAPISLPQGIYLVPKDTSTTYSGGAIFEPATSDWTNRVSDAFVDSSPGTISNLSGTYRRVVGITVRGTVSPVSATGNLVLAAGDRRSADTVAFVNPNAVRGAQLSRYGVLTLINDAQAF